MIRSDGGFYREFRERYREYNDNALADSDNNPFGIAEGFAGGGTSDKRDGRGEHCRAGSPSPLLRSRRSLASLSDDSSSSDRLRRSCVITRGDIGIIA